MRQLNDFTSPFELIDLEFPALSLSYYLNQIRPYGNIVYEYNPLRNYRLSSDTVINGELVEAGSIVDLDTDGFNFSLNNPLEIDAQSSYDGSVNLIFNDNRNIPRLVNSRFSVLQNNTYEVVDRIGNNDTNLYDSEQFDLDTSLYKRVNTIPTITFNSVLPSGNLKVGNYVIYIKYADADGNETDFVGESGIISCFIGGDRDPFSIDGGFRDQLASKSISLTVSDIDSSYDYIKVYYTRSTSDVDSNRVVTAHEIDRKFPVRNNSCNVIITGSEETKDIPVSDINIQYSIIDKAKSQTVCQNMLFLGNSCKPDMMYKDLSDISLRLLPYLIESDSERFIGKTSYDYSDLSDQSYSHEYYNTLNIYNKVGYWNEEIYRFGVVYIMKDGSLSPVYNIRGKNGIPKFEELQSAYLQSDLWKYENNEKVRNYIPIDESTFDVSGTSYLENAKGVLRINTDSDSRKVYGIGIAIPTEVSEYLNTLVQGLFIVRQKRIPTILAQAYVMPRDLEAEVPLINYGGSYIAERFLDNDRKLNESYLPRLYTISDMAKVNRSAKVAICPEYDVRQSYFNHLFTGTEYVVRKADIQPSMTTLSRDIYNDRHYYVDNYYGRREEQFSRAKIIGVGDNVPIAAVEDYNFRGRAGEAEEGFRFRYIESKNKEKEATNLIRGAYSPYLGIIGDQVTIGSIINIYIPGYSEAQMSTYFNTRYEDNSPYYSVSSRLSLANIDSLLSLQKAGGDLYTYTVPCYRGDCYICNFTHRLNRNFQDPSAPTNDEVVDENTWKDNYDTENTENNAKINRGDVNAIQLGSWITFKVCSSYNLSIRSLDPSYPTEEGLTGLKRGFYPLQELSPAGATKIPESSVINGGYSSTTSEKQAFTLPDVPYIKNRFDTRIMYSDISVGDAFKNGFRVFQMTHYRDYPRTYGGIMKMIELFGNILCIFEHGIALIPVNERAVAGEGSGGNVFINTSNVLPENPKMLSDTYGTQWPESVVQTPYFVYGVDTVGKKIWRTNGNQFEIISDFKIQEFLNENITLSEREMTPIIGVRNVKGHYNAFKQDVMFTFYDDLYGFEEKVWNICYNEVMQKFITFYSWVPSYSANIDNIHFSFNRDTSKWISKLASSGSLSTSADGIVLSNVVIDDWETKDDMKLTKLGLVNRSLPNTQNTGLEIELTYEIVKDNFGMYKHFKIITEGEKQNKVSYLALKEDFEWTVPVVQLNLQCTIDYLYSSESAPQDLDDYVAGWKDYVTYNAGLYQSSIAITKQEVLDNGVNEGLNLTTDFWKHGQSGIIDIKDPIKPCFWYGKQHPFEYEFVVVDNPSVHKIFNNLHIISNKAKPDSFHYEIVGEVYDFHDDKKNMYIRQEATKDFYQYNGSDILYNRNFLNLRGSQRPISRNGIATGAMDKSTMFPLYYARVDTFNEVEDYYRLKTAPNKDYVNLSGTEIVYNEKLNEFRVWTHAKAVDIKDPTAGRLRGNMNYQEDVWDVQINSITFVQKNEPTWNKSNVNGEVINKVPISVGNSPIPNDLKGFDISESTPVENFMPSDLRTLGYNIDDIDVSDWWSGRKETRLRDKYIKIRVRYTGEELAIITALKTLFTISYA